MSIRNQRTGRHEDDLHDEIMRDGSTTLAHLIEHLNETIVEVPEAYGSNVCAPVKMATLVLESLIATGMITSDVRVTL